MVRIMVKGKDYGKGYSMLLALEPQLHPAPRARGHSPVFNLSRG